MRFLVSVLLIALLSFIAGRYLPWYSLAFVAFGVGAFVPQRLLRAFLSGFLGIFLLWFLLALWLDTRNEQLLSQRVAELLHLGQSSVLLLLVTGLVGGIVGGLAALSGASLRATPVTKAGI
ncbi:hypothetical protein [Flaviaesturariibacter aridisoli]|uniref:Uncharacterized protein n=1 Tax=Flaviaesturariibacter aridisoli TaxID=2545761 RepID=A0A4R4E4I9_9BACT|nr:hypothetical protein [Flaviaesturariibacter aridisoli]TCZ73857.1 hypothetical protein E0486_04025 [Flaviaesturariibacter aridisoli]